MRGAISNRGRVEAIGRLREQVGRALLEHGLDEVGIGTEVGRDQAGDAGRPVQQGVAHGTGDLVDRAVGGRGVEQPALLGIEGHALGFDLQGQLRHPQPSVRRGVSG